jgi:hypothetical protein
VASAGERDVSPDEPPLPIHPGLRSRFRLAAAKIEWTPTLEAPDRPPGPLRRRARIGEEEAWVEEWGSAADGGLRVDSGPLGALVLMLACDQRGVPTTMGASHAGRDAGFPAGAIVAVWGTGPAPTDARPRLQDIVDLARYALE